MAFLEVNDIKKSFGKNEILKGISFDLQKGEVLSIIGSSGSGKTTLLRCINFLEFAESGTITVNGETIYDGVVDKKIKEKDLRKKRLHFGLVFQDFNLLDNFSIEDNIKLPLVLAGEDYKKMDAKVQKAAGQLGIVELLKKYPYEVSGGQKQRTAIARALITNPRILLADEPTGALDSKAATNLLKQLREINQTGQTILMVTHSNVAASYADRVMFIKDGEVFHQIYRGDMTRSAMLDKICDAVTVLMRGGEDSES